MFTFTSWSTSYIVRWKAPPRSSWPVIKSSDPSSRTYFDSCPYRLPLFRKLTIVSVVLRSSTIMTPSRLKKPKDPQYLRKCISPQLAIYYFMALTAIGILPAEFKLHDSVVDGHESILSMWRQLSFTEKMYNLVGNDSLYYGSWLSHLDTQCTIYQDAGAFEFLNAEPFDGKYWHDKFCAQERFYKAAGIESSGDFLFFNHILKALKEVGLDIHGGLTRLAQVWKSSVGKGLAFPTTCITVRNSEKARKYIDIGIIVLSDSQVDMDRAVDHHGACKNATRISALVARDDWEMEEDWGVAKWAVMRSISPGDLYDTVWEYEREKFRFEVLKRFQKIEQNARKQMDGDSQSTTDEEMQCSSVRPTKRARVLR
ncbi:unnamed protein product [Periconia digitata]|uniref:Uncharacterized protein n=1 Tax=Periconia digitata TaxID=1303443 RepID=A0A9W4US37_9PLEO|nr:unnamed protein product [Periconia digitata]